jgi:hypothetical protein
MQHLRKNRFKFKITALFVILIFASTCFSAGFTAGRILPKGKVTLFQGSRQIGEFSSEAPLPEDTLLAVQGECGVKLRHLYLYAIDQSLFSVSTNKSSRTLNVQKGTVYFALSSMPRTLVFQTPAGTVTINEVVVNASSANRLLKGYVYVEDGITRVGVLEGGSMLVTGAEDKPLEVSPGHELRMAQAEIFKEGEKSSEEKSGEAGKTGEMSTTTKVIIGVLGAGALAAALGGGGGGGGGSAPPPASISSP